METTVEIEAQPNLLQVFWNYLRGKAHTVSYGKHVHFRGKDNTTGKIEVGSILFGWHTTKDGKQVHGNGYVSQIEGNKAVLQLNPVQHY